MKAILEILNSVTILEVFLTIIIIASIIGIIKSFLEEDFSEALGVLMASVLVLKISLKLLVKGIKFNELAINIKQNPLSLIIFLVFLLIIIVSIYFGRRFFMYKSNKKFIDKIYLDFPYHSNEIKEYKKFGNIYNVTLKSGEIINYKDSYDDNFHFWLITRNVKHSN